MRKQAVTIGAMGIALLALAGPPPAAAKCSEGHADPTGESILHCGFADAPEFSWPVPARVFEITAWLYGAGAENGTSGGTVRAKLPVTPGQTLQVRLGSDGGASSLTRNGVPLLVAGGGDGHMANYIAPAAEAISISEPGDDEGGLSDGAVVLQWQPNPDPPQDPLPSTIYDFFADRTVGFPPSDDPQTWTAPDDLVEVVFQLRGGAGESGFPEGHVVAEFPVSAGDRFEIEVGGAGEATTLRRADTGELIARAAGSDDWTTNFLAPAAFGSTRYEGGGDDPFPWHGFAAIHQWLKPATPPTPVPPRDSDPLPPPDVVAPPTADVRAPAQVQLSCRLRGRRVTLRRCRLVAGRLARQRVVSDRAIPATP